MMTKFRAKLDSVLISGAHAGYWAGATVFSSFLVTFLIENGYTESQIGLIVTFMSLFNLISQPFWGYLADAKWDIKAVTLICMGMSIPVVLFLPLLLRSTLLLTIGCIIASCFENPVKGLLDSITNISEEKNRYIVYGIARGCGSFFSAIASLLAGNFLYKYGINWAFVIHGVLAGFALICLIAFSGKGYPENKDIRRNVSRKKDMTLKRAVRELSGNRLFLAVFVSTVLLNIGLKAGLTFTPVMINNFGGNSSHNGYSMAVNTIGMLPMMVLYSWLYRKKKINNAVIYLWACLFTVIRIASLAMVNSLWPLIFVQIINSLSYGFLQPAMIESIRQTTPLYLRSTAITLVTGVYLAIASVTVDYLAGVLIEHVGIKPMFGLCTILAILGTIAYLPVLRAANGGKQNYE